jgi:hypothetical protein
MIPSPLTSAPMSNVTMEGIASLLSEELKPINTRLDTIEKTLNHHTTILDGLAKDVKTLLDGKAITDHRFERLEHWAQQVGQKLGIKLEL